MLKLDYYLISLTLVLLISGVIVADALERAYLFGRNGRGCPVIFSAGNRATTFPGFVSYPANHWTTFAGWS